MQDESAAPRCDHSVPEGTPVAPRRKVDVELELSECDLQIKRHKTDAMRFRANEAEEMFERARVSRDETARQLSQEEDYRRLKILKEVIAGKDALGLGGLDVERAREVSRDIFFKAMQGSSTLQRRNTPDAAA